MSKRARISTFRREEDGYFQPGFFQFVQHRRWKASKFNTAPAKFARVCNASPSAMLSANRPQVVRIYRLCVFEILSHVDLPISNSNSIVC
jgi:hypothetical protein